MIFMRLVVSTLIPFCLHYQLCHPSEVKNENGQSYLNAIVVKGYRIIPLICYCWYMALPLDFCLVYFKYHLLNIVYLHEVSKERKFTYCGRNYVSVVRIRCLHRWSKSWIQNVAAVFRWSTLSVIMVMKYEVLRFIKRTMPNQDRHNLA